MYTLRQSITEDQAVIGELYLQMLQSIYHTNDVNGYERGYLDKFYAGQEDRILVAESDGKVIGYLSVEVHREAREPYLYLDDFCIAEEHRGQGIGSSMLKEAEEFSKKLEIPVIMLHVENSNSAAQKLYRRMGYTALCEEGNRTRMLLRR